MREPYLTNDNITTSISFFEADKDATIESRSVNRFTFSQDSRYIYINIKISVTNHPLNNSDVTLHVKFYDRNGVLKFNMEPFTSVISKEESSHEFWSGAKQQWLPGRYSVVFYINGIEQPTVYFNIT